MMTGVVTPSAIGRLRVERQLGAGGFATVWLAHDPDLDAPVAVKILAENFAAHADIRRRFSDEARLLRRVDSDHVVRVYDVGELPDGRPFFVMTYADGGSLAERLARVPPPWPAHSVLSVVDAVADGLAVLHRHGVVHRDIKPVNILLRAAPDGGERVVLGDLGIAKDLQWASGLTMPAGSSGYAAPEQESYSEHIGPATDVHALAMTAAQMMALRQPWPVGPLGAALARATDPDPQRRTVSATAFAAELREALGQAPTPALTPVPVPSTHVGPTVPPPPPPGVLSGTPSGTPSGLPSGASPGMRPGMASGAPPPAGPAATRRRVVVSGVAAFAVVLAVGTAAWTLTHRPHRISPVDGGVSVEVPHAWTGRAGVEFPDSGDADDGVRAGAGGRSISVALDTTFSDAATVLAQVRPQGCTLGGTRDVRVGPWTGRTEHFTGCPDGVDVDEVALGAEGRDDFTVWVEVRSVSGDPDLGDVLASLEIDATAG